MKGRDRLVRRMGYARDQEGIMRRYLHESEYWRTHLERTREFIESSLEDPSIRSVAVLGSGWLLDVPLDAMRKRFEHVYLADVRHPPQIRKKTASMENVTLLEEDLSGGAMEQVWKAARSGEIPGFREMAQQLRLSPPLQGIMTDAMVSVNLLNQLDILLCDFLRRKDAFRPESAESFRSCLQAFHLDWITSKPGCLVTDTKEVNLPGKGEPLSRRLLYTPLPDGFRKDRWQWDFDRSGTYREGFQTRMEIEAVEWS